LRAGLAPDAAFFYKDQVVRARADAAAFAGWLACASCASCAIALSDPPDGPSADGPIAVDAPLPPADGHTQLWFDAPPADALPTPGGPHLLLSEVAVRPTEAEFIEIYNPTLAPIDLSTYYLADRADYYRITTGQLLPQAGDFVLRFPDGASIGPGTYQTVALHGASNFQSVYGQAPTYEAPDTALEIPDMRAALPGVVASDYALADYGEPVVLFSWDGRSDLVQDVDYLLYGNPLGMDGPVDKGGVSIDGIDPDSLPSRYRPERPAGAQVPLGTHLADGSLHRCLSNEAGEVPWQGNGITGHDETSEPWLNTWHVNVRTPSMRTPGAGPPSGFCP
jgi:hypothetical protein